MWWSGGPSWWVWPIMTFVMVAFWGAAAWVVVVAVRSAQTRTEARRPEEILAERFAQGEIDEAEYQQRRTAMRSSVGSR
jgi:putative membrane protein